jgi:hypothetical protein
MHSLALLICFAGFNIHTFAAHPTEIDWIVDDHSAPQPLLQTGRWLPMGDIEVEPRPPQRSDVSPSTKRGHGSRIPQLAFCVPDFLISASTWR